MSLTQSDAGTITGTDVRILTIFSAKKIAFFDQTTVKTFKKLIIALVFEKKTPIFSPKIGKNRRKL
jgi:hypothetical protein